MAEKYRFSKEKHLHQLLVDGEWKALTGITTVLSVIAKPALISWAANMVAWYIEENAPHPVGKDYHVSVPLLEEARKAHTKKKESAGDWGTTVHGWIESYLKDEKPDPLKEEKQELACGNFIKWIDDNKVKVLESEKHLYSETLWLGGITDLVVEIDGKVWVADIKTGSVIYEEAFFQMAGYQLMLEEQKLYKDIAGHIVLNFRKDGSFEERRCVSNDDNRNAFLAALTLYRVKEKIKNQIIN